MKLRSPLSIVFVAAVLSALSMAPAWAGKEGGNGGGAFICQDNADSELLDLFEAGIRGITADYPLDIERSDATVEVQIQAAFAKLGVESREYGHLMNVYAQVKAARQNPMRPGYIAWPKDAVNEVTKPGCTPTGIVFFHDEDNSMLIDRHSLSQLPNTDQAALWVHETVYKYFREAFGHPDSVLARKVVGYLFSTETTQKINQAYARIAHVDNPSLPVRPIDQPKECAPGTVSTVVAFFSEDSASHAESSHVLQGRIFSAPSDYSKRQHDLGRLDVANGKATQVCLPPGNYIYEYKVKGSGGHAFSRNYDDGGWVYARNGDVLSGDGPFVALHFPERGQSFFMYLLVKN